jgi:hypothetical protein
MEKGKLDDIIQSSIGQTVKISEDDIKQIAEAVKLSILSDIQQMIDLKTQPPTEKINVLEKVNRQLTNDLDNLEQYCFCVIFLLSSRSGGVGLLVR